MNLSGNPIDFLFAFFGGVFISFSPCTYPLLPVSIGFIGVRAGGSKLKALSLSLAYVSGVALSYSLLGVLASLTGTFFGQLSRSRPVLFIVGAIIILFGLSLFEVFSLPALGLRIKAPAGRRDYLYAFFLGVSSAFMIAPCVTPVLGAILLYLATKANVLYGALLLFIFAYGMGLLLILAGTFSAIFVSLPKSGRWIILIKRLYAVILLAAGLYFIFLSFGRR